MGHPRHLTQRRNSNRLLSRFGVVPSYSGLIHWLANNRRPSDVYLFHIIADFLFVVQHGGNVFWLLQFQVGLFLDSSLRRGADFCFEYSLVLYTMWIPANILEPASLFLGEFLRSYISHGAGVWAA